MKAYALQMTSCPDVQQNLAFIRNSLEQNQPSKNDLVVLPECFAYFGGKERENIALAEPLGSGVIQSELAEIADKYNIYLVAGTLPILAENDHRACPMTLVISPQGQQIAKYQKIHLFDVDVADGIGQYRESESWQPGGEIATFKWQGLTVGLAICYDVRFAGVFSLLAQQGAELVVLPSAFTQKTGQAHWQTLLQARAIENQIYMLGCGQSGTHLNERQTHGHSMIVDPWGEILVNAKDKLGLFGADIDTEYLKKVRQAMPVLKHNKIKYELAK